MNLLTKRLAEALDETTSGLLDENGDPDTIARSLDLLKEYAEIEKTPRDHFHMVFGEVIYRNKNGNVQGTRVNVFTKAADMQFPARRLHHIQNSCAMQARIELGDPKVFDVHNVNILGMYYLGEFTDVEFYAGIQSIEEPAPIEKSADGKVVPIIKQTEN